MTAWIFGSWRLSSVTSSTPVSTLAGTGCLLQVRDHRLHAQVAHVHRVLHDEALELALAQRLEEAGAVVEADEGDRAGLADVLQREQHAGGRRLVGREDAVDARREAIEQVLGRPLRRVARRAGVLIRRDHRHAREAALQLGQEARLALLRGRRSLLVAQHQDGALALQQLAHAPAGEVPALAVVGAHVAHGRMRRLERRVEDDGRECPRARLLRPAASGPGCRAAPARCPGRPG